MDVVVGVPVTERSVLKLVRLLWGLAESYDSIALPLPSSLCLEAVTASSRVLDIALKYMNRAQVRVWSSLLLELPRLAEALPDLAVSCYLPDNFYEHSEEVGYKIAALVVKAKVFNKVDVKEWMELFRQPSKYKVDVGNTRVLVADGYSWTVRAYREYGAKELKVAERLIPTPLDLLELTAYGYLEPENAEEIIKYAVRYVGEYVTLSKSLTEAYDKLVEDEGYRELLEKLKIKILE